MKKYPIDYLVFTIIERESRAFRGYGDTERKDENGNLCYKSIHENENGYKFDIVHYNVGKSGNQDIAIEVTNALHCWDPSYIVVMGIAAGFAEKNIKLGDILISNDIIYYSKGKQHAWGYEPRPTYWKSSDTLTKFLKEAERYEWSSDPKVHCDCLDNYHPSVFVGTILSGEVVMDSSEWVKMAQEDYIFKTALGLEMEAAGAHNAVCKTLDSTNVVTLRGVSDLGHGKKEKEEERQECAARSVAAFFVQYLKKSKHVPNPKADFVNRKTVFEYLKKEKGVAEVDDDFLDALNRYIVRRFDKEYSE